MISIKLPGTLNFSQSAAFTVALDELPAEDEYQFDYSPLTTVEPFGMLLVGAKIRQFMDSRAAKYTAWNFEAKHYAAHMGFFQSIGLDYGRLPGEALGNENYVAITQIRVQQLRQKAAVDKEYIQETVEKEALKLARVLSQGNEELRDYLNYSLRELMRNTVEHSDADSIWVAGQCWPTKDLVEIAILDEGIGIMRGLLRNRKLVVRNEQEALALALEPGISGTSKSRWDASDIWSNSGFGLYMTSSLCQLGGNFVICSGGRVLHVASERSFFTHSRFQGTAARMRLQVSKIGKLSQVLARLAREGEKKSRANKQQSIITASKVSSILVTDKE